MPAGRPSEYSNEVLEIANAYLDNFKLEHQHAIPSLVGLAKILRKSRECLYNWARDEDKKEFSDILEQINTYQEFELINGGLTGELNSNITKLALGKHGYSDKADTTIANPDGSNIEVSTDIEIARKLAFVLDKALKDNASV